VEFDAAFGRFQEIRKLDIATLSYGTKIPLSAFDFVALLENVESRYAGLEPKYTKLFFEKIEVPLAMTFLEVVGRAVNLAGDGFSGIVARRVEDSCERVGVYAGCLSGLGHVVKYLKEAGQSDVRALGLIDSFSWRWLVDSKTTRMYSRS
jgi:hypothetical protein